MKRFALSLALLSSVAVISATKLEVELTHNGNIINEVLDLDVAQEVIHQAEDLSLKLNVTQKEDGILLVETEITAPNQDGVQEVVATPVLVIGDEEASVVLGSSEGDELKLVVHAVK